MEVLGIGEVALQTGLRASAIRYYEEKGLVPRGRRRGGRRVYEPSILDRLALIELAKDAGFRLAEIQRLLHGFGRRVPAGDRWRALAASKQDELEARIASARRMQRVLRNLEGCACPTLEDCGRALRSRD